MNQIYKLYNYIYPDITVVYMVSYLQPVPHVRADGEIMMIYPLCLLCEYKLRKRCEMKKSVIHCVLV